LQQLLKPDRYRSGKVNKAPALAGFLFTGIILCITAAGNDIII
jgi:hypothetical protein